MTPEANSPVAEEAPRPVVSPDGMAMVLPPRLTENFRKAEAQLLELYGLSPGVPALINLWLACGTSSRIRTEFEQAVLDIKRPGLSPNEQGDFDEDSL